MNVIVLNMRGQPLMPCAPAKARKLLKAGKAVVVRKWPFAIQLKIATGENRQFTDCFPLPPFPFALPNRPKAGFENHLVWFRKYTAREMKACPHDKGPMELKIVHTMKVVDLARSICHSEGLEKQETYISLLSALYHDVGRFLQYRLWQSFRDRESANHGLIGESILKFCHVLGNEPNEVKAEVTKAVRWHNAAEIPEGMQESVALKVVRDADKIDILRVIDGHLSGPGPYEPTAILSLPDDPELFSQKVIDCALEGSTASYEDLRSVNDFRLLLGSWINGLNFEAARRVLAAQGHVERLLSPLPENIYGAAKKAVLETVSKYRV